MKKKIKWGEIIFWFVLIFMPYIGIPLVWIIKRKYKRNTKIIISVIAAMWCICMIGSSDGEQTSSIDDTSIVSETREIVENQTESVEIEGTVVESVEIEGTVAESVETESAEEIHDDVEELQEETETIVDEADFSETKTSEVISEENTQESLEVEQLYESVLNFTVEDDVLAYNAKEYTIIDVDGGDRSGDRSSNVAVDIGFGDRVYWALTNEYGQLVYVLAEQIILQNDETEPVNSSGRYYSDEANVPGTEYADLDQGHVIADSLGGVANAYNITPQESTLNRYGDQAYMESAIRDAGGCTNFVATITYTTTDTQIPSKYKYTYTLMGNTILDEFDNVNPDDYNEEHNVYETPVVVQEEPQAETVVENPISADTTGEETDLSSIDTNGNGKVTIAEAKAAGYSMPIYSDHWLYEYMDDRDGDGMVGE